MTNRYMTKAEARHRCPDTNDGALIVIKVLGVCLVLIVLGAVLSALLLGRPFPEWIKDTVTAIVVGLVGILAKSSRFDSQIPIQPDGSIQTTTTIDNKKDDPIPTTTVDS